MSLAMPSPRASRATADLAPEIVSRLVRGGLVVLGGVIVVAGVIIAPLPGPGGIPVIALGLVVVLRNSYAAKKAFVRAHRRWPTVVHPLRRLMRKEPEIAPVFWQAYLRVERFALPKRYRLGVRGRHFVKRKFGGNEA